ncbi:uncharacterized protein M421DRAFT_92548 [Didymella exigua CBS 183.55]|uniref:Transmembrane protein n=1 Tax=Didymella exigua CBS 183.55 TaxID=1150837 RepID=A0A6A5RLY3_9PLEO|nr:uncharacterized protein M421DRAFT_92548 [Didymella exigua CBS 183.55]KAF1928270.1 hypothetical protein M421DRAFT_92548 [Didymella exigua CBS 183.55]
MRPAAHHGHRQRRPRAQKVTHVEHQGVGDVTSIYEIVPPSASAVPSSCSAHEASHSLPSTPLPCTLATLATTATATATAKHTSGFPATPSTYPKHSPPMFLYSHPIVPPKVFSHTMQTHGPRPLHRSLAHKEHYSANPPLAQIGAALLVFVLVTATAWCIIVMGVHWRGTTTGMVPASQRRRCDEREYAIAEAAGWWARQRAWTRWASYAALRSDDGDGSPAYELGTATRDLCTHLATGTQDASPTNPYLVPPSQRWRRAGRQRGSAEWAEEHRSYFSASGTRSPAAGSASRGLGSPRSLSGAELEEVESEAREAQGRGASLACGDSREALGKTERTSWVDLGLAAVDGAVDRLAGKIVRYTEDGGKDEALLLPLTKSKQD